MRRRGIGPNLTRRRTLKGMTACGSIAVAAGAFPSMLRAQPSQMVVASGGGALDEAFRKAFYDPWTAKTGIEIVSATNQPAQLKVMVEQSAVEWDVMQGPAEIAAQFSLQDLLEPLDYGVIDRSALIEGVAHDHYVLTDVAAYNIAWNTENTPPEKVPDDWAGMWATEGRIGLWKRPFQTMEAALLADGAAPDQLYPLDVERALASLERIRDKILWWDRGAQSAQLLIDGEVEVGATWNGRVHEPKLSGAPVDYHFNEAVLVSDAFVIPKGAPNLKESMQFLAFILEPEQQAAFSTAIPYGPVNPAALELIPPERQQVLPSSEENLGKGVFLNNDWWAENGEEVGERFNEWVLG